MTSHINPTYEEYLQCVSERQKKRAEEDPQKIVQWNAYSKEVKESLLNMYCVRRQLRNIIYNTNCRIKYGEEYDEDYMEWHPENYDEIREEFVKDYGGEDMAVEIIDMVNEADSGVTEFM